MSGAISIDNLAEEVSNRAVQGLVVAPDEVWFPYSIEAVKLLKVGLILAVKNTASVHLEQMVADFIGELEAKLAKLDALRR